MNDTTANDLSSVPWQTSDQRVRVPDTSMLPGSESTPSALGKLLNQGVHGAHDAVDRLADSAAPAVRQLGERVAAAEEALSDKTDQLRDIRDEWVASARTTVRGSPLVAVAAALALGAVFARITR